MHHFQSQGYITQYCCVMITRKEKDDIRFQFVESTYTGVSAKITLRNTIEECLKNFINSPYLYHIRS